jgi:transposase InsO family protein
MMRSLVSGRGPRFTSVFWKQLCQVLRVKLKMSTPRHPQTDGQSEEAIHYIKQVLRAFCNNSSNNNNNADNNNNNNNNTTTSNSSSSYRTGEPTRAEATRPAVCAPALFGGVFRSCEYAGVLPLICQLLPK